jgi:hypothetical protein
VDLTADLYPHSGIPQIFDPALPREVSELLTWIVPLPDATPGQFVTQLTPAGVKQGLRVGISSTSTIDQEGREVVIEKHYWCSGAAWPVGELCDPQLCAPRRRRACARLGPAKAPRWRPAITSPRRRASGRRHSSSRSRRAAASRQGGDPPGEPPDAKSAPHDLLPGIGALSPERLFKEHCLPKEDRREPLKEACRALNLPQPSLSSPSFDLGSAAPGVTRLIRVSGPAPDRGRRVHGSRRPAGTTGLRRPNRVGGGQ